MQTFSRKKTASILFMFLLNLTVEVDAQITEPELDITNEQSLTINNNSMTGPHFSVEYTSHDQNFKVVFTDFFGGYVDAALVDEYDDFVSGVTEDDIQDGRYVPLAWICTSATDDMGNQLSNALSTETDVVAGHEYVIAEADDGSNVTATQTQDCTSTILDNDKPNDFLHNKQSNQTIFIAKTTVVIEHI